MEGGYRAPPYDFNCFLRNSSGDYGLGLWDYTHYLQYYNMSPYGGVPILLRVPIQTSPFWERYFRPSLVGVCRNAGYRGPVSRFHVSFDWGSFRRFRVEGLGFRVPIKNPKPLTLKARPKYTVLQGGEVQATWPVENSVQRGPPQSPCLTCGCLGFRV